MIVGLVGRSRVGKDTVASMLPGFTVKRLAQPIKEACQALYGFEDLESDAKEQIDHRIGLSPRHAMVDLTLFMQAQVGPKYFVNKLFESWDGKGDIVIPDVRFSHDIEEIKRRGGVTVKVTRIEGPLHSWEDHIDSLACDFHVTNSGSLGDLRTQVDSLRATGWRC
jgi:hypothetical protein